MSDTENENATHGGVVDRGPEEWSSPAELPAELIYESVHGCRNRCEPKRQCYHVLLHETEIPLEYRRQWKDDWSVLTVKIEDEDKLNVVLLEKQNPGMLDRFL